MEDLNFGYIHNKEEEQFLHRFRFYPTNEEIITHYHKRKALVWILRGTRIYLMDLKKCEPWDLAGMFNSLFYYSVCIIPHTHLILSDDMWILNAECKNYVLQNHPFYTFVYTKHLSSLFQLTIPFHFIWSSKNCVNLRSQLFSLFWSTHKF